MGRLEELVGVETDLARVSGIVQEFARTLGAPVVGAYHVTCSDESEWECAQAFQQSFAQAVLPALKQGRRAVFRSVNLGARYEAGAIGIAEQHFATGESQKSFKLMVVKINAHVAVRTTPATVLRSAMPSAARPRALACAASSSACEAPRRKEKLVVTASSA